MKTQKEVYEEHLENFPDSRRAFEFQNSERQEAIKWIKAIVSCKSYKDCLVGQKIDCNFDCACCDVANAFQTFFNITEEELI